MYPKIQVSSEYVETLCVWLQEWADKESSLVITQFLCEKGISWKYFKQIKEASPLLENAFELTIATLHTRWLQKALQKEEIPRALYSTLMRYLKIYDSHAFEVETSAKREIAESTQTSHITIYEAENFRDTKLSGRFKELYDNNANRRRSRSEA